MKGIKTAAKSKYQSDNNLTKSLSDLSIAIAREDEDRAIKLQHTWRKFFGYIQMCNMSPEINIVLFNEASVRIYHELSKQDIIYIDATGNLFSNEKTYNRLLYYAIVIRNPYPQNSPIPVVEYISSQHTAQSIGLMIRKLKERERAIFPKGVTPALVMSDFSMAIINASLREFNNESLGDYFERGFRIVTGKATKAEAEKTIHHVCSAHMMQLIKRHAKDLCEKGLPTKSQVHIAMRFFGRLLSANTLHDMKDIIRLGYTIFNTKYVSTHLTEELEKFSETIHTFHTFETCDGSNQSESDEDAEKESDEEHHTENDIAIETCSVKQFWEKELELIRKTNKIEESSEDTNKYFMPRYFEYVVKNYLPSCLLWSNLLLGDLTRYNDEIAAISNLSPISSVRNYLKDNRTNGEVEDFFRIKKKCSFKGRRHLRLDTFIGENWKDNLALQREFVDGILRNDAHGRKSGTLKRIQRLIHAATDVSSNFELESDSSIDEMLDKVATEYEEKWCKPSPSRGTKKQGKYLNPSEKFLNFNPSLPNESELRDKVHRETSFNEYEQHVWADVSKKVKGHQDIRKAIKKMWSKRQRKTKAPSGEEVKVMNSRKKNTSETSKNSGSLSKDMMTSIPHCICRQKRYFSAVSCVLCNEIFHCDCIDFCEGLAAHEPTRYFCTNCIYINFIPFTRYVLHCTSTMDHLSKEKIAELYDGFLNSGSHDSSLKQCESTIDQENMNVCTQNSMSLVQWS